MFGIFLASLSFKDVLDIIVKFIGLPTAVAGVITLIIRVRNSQKERRKAAFKARLDQVRKVSSTSTIENENYYKEKYGDELAKSYGLIIDKDWVIYQDKREDNTGDKIEINSINDLIELSEIETEVQTIDKEISIPSYRIFPNYKKFGKKTTEQTYVHNYLKYNDKATYLFNGKLFAAKDIVKSGNKVKFILHKTDYYSFLNTCKVLELLYETKERKQKLDIDILDLTNRYAGIGINCLTIIKNVRKRTNPKKKANYFLIHQRTSKVIESPDHIHVVPAGSYQPIVSIDHEHDPKLINFNKDMSNTAYREFCEEILNTAHMSEINSYSLLTESNDYQFCKKFLKVYYIGAGLEPYNTKMEILALAIIDIDEILKEKDSELITKFIDEHKVVNNTIKSLKENEKMEEKINLDLISSIIANQEEVKEYISYEGKIKLEKLSKAMFEQYYSDNHTTPSAKEIFGFMYQHYEEILTDTIKK